MRIQITLPGGYENAKGEKGVCGEVVDFRDELALKLLLHGFAKEVAAPAVETVAAAPPENVARRVGKPGPRKTVK